MNTFLSRIPARYWGYTVLALWGGLTLLLLRQDLYVLNEGAAKALLLSWSIADQVASSVIHFGTPDLRALLFMPIGYLWTGNVLAAKIVTSGLLALTVWLLYGWAERRSGAEVALIACGLLIISPLSIEQIDSLSPGIYLLCAFALGAWLDNAYRANPKSFGGWYFTQLLVCAFAVSLHPAGLAYPLSLLWSWRTEPLDRNQQKYFLVGISSAVLLTLVIRMGWNDLSWFQNPIASLSTAVSGTSLSDTQSTLGWIAGGALFAMLILVIGRKYRDLWSDLTGRTFLIALALGAFCADQAWAFVALALILFTGIPLLLRSVPEGHSGGFFRQRGVAFMLIFGASTFFMLGDRAHYERKVMGVLPSQDALIKSLAEEVESARKASEEKGDDSAGLRFIVASQWPSRTMIACKCDTLPLPPPAADPEAQLAMLQGKTPITHVLLDPRLTSNVALARNLALLGGAVETAALQQGGVVLHVKETVSGSR